MRCQSPTDVDRAFGSLGFSVDLENQWYRSALVLDAAQSAKQTRLAAAQPTNFSRLDDFIRTANRWLPTNQERLLWIDHWETGLRGGHENAMAAMVWKALGETRSLVEAPGLLLTAQNWDEQDQVEIAPAQAEALAILVGLTTTIMSTSSDGWLISQGSLDRIEFWEGNVFFHSQEQSQLKRANEILDDFGCVRWKS
jgi:hypothetical protein